MEEKCGIILLLRCVEFNEFKTNGSNEEENAALKEELESDIEGKNDGMASSTFIGPLFFLVSPIILVPSQE